jgi:hypothetical protein
MKAYKSDLLVVHEGLRVHEVVLVVVKRLNVGLLAWAVACPLGCFVNGLCHLCDFVGDS